MVSMAIGIDWDKQYPHLNIYGYINMQIAVYSAKGNYVPSKFISILHDSKGNWIGHTKRSKAMVNETSKHGKSQHYYTKKVGKSPAKVIFHDNLYKTLFNLDHLIVRSTQICY